MTDPAIVLYDDTCPKCRALAAMARAVKRNTKFVPMSSEEGKALLAQLGKDNRAYHIIKGGEVYSGTGVTLAGLKALFGR